ncbi:ABC transporter ATP-binding protein [Telluribacter sp.]|jgi:iron(III) transport system ATP-binding protein|uniref:ABC transporter ATP-binding protein n=1 Tax=Telluribacter sp. TaxID=1978767 RepID=UPI002E10E538|nr:ABC transporter ATP-binding protein [Telluribacter sp.]
MTLVRTRSLSKTFEEIKVLDEVAFTLKKGRWLGILGESGSGKSTLLRIIGRFIDQDRGEVIFKNEALSPVKDQLIPGHPAIKLVHQEFELFPNQTVLENIAYSLRFYEPGYRNERVEELLQLTRLHHVQDHKAKLLSGGEKQRTAIAKALAELPEVLLLDEPFAHLDNWNRLAMTEAIARLRKKQDMACIFVTHEASDALAWSDEVAVLRNGKIIQRGAPQAIYNQPVNAYVAELTGSVNWLGEAVAGKRRFVRPEKVKLTKNPDKCRWEGRVETVRFRGSYWEYLCVNKKRERMDFYRQKADLPVGESVTLTYFESDVRTVSE